MSDVENRKIPDRIIPDRVLHLLKRFVTEPQQLVSVLYFLAHDKCADAMLQVLDAVADSETMFAEMAKKLVDDTRHLSEDDAYRTFMNDLWTNYLRNDYDAAQADETAKEFDVDKLLKINKANVVPSAVSVFLKTAARLPPVARRQVIGSIGGMAAGRELAVGSSSSIVSATRIANWGRIVSVGLVAVQLSWEAWQSICKWWRGEISGKRCVKNIIDSTVSAVAGVAGGYGGAAVGTLIAPGVGTVIGAIVCSIAASSVAGALSDWLTRTLFDLPKDVALENAYRFFQLPQSASNSDINSKYRQLALEYHPDKGGDRDDWNRLQCCLAVIKVSRGEA